jgi:hypothetical protein
MRLFMNGRHESSPDNHDAVSAGNPPTLRTNIDYVFILREPYLTNQDLGELCVHVSNAGGVLRGDGPDHREF